MISRCAVFGAAFATGAANTLTVTRIEVAGNTFDGNGVRPWRDYNSCGTHSQYRGAAVHLVSRHGTSWFTGSIANNTITGNLTGIAFAQSGNPPLPGTIPPPEPKGLTIAGNEVAFQLLSPAFPVGLPPGGCGFVPLANPSDGVGIVLGDDIGYNSPGPGTLDATTILERNRVHGNARHGVQVVLWRAGTPGPTTCPGTQVAPGSDISPVLRNNRIHHNGTVAAPPTGAPGDGVRLDFLGALCLDPMTMTLQGGPGLRFQPALVNETVVYNTNPTGFGVNNVAGAAHPFSRPTLENSIVYFNGPTFSGPDLNGFSFLAPGVNAGGVVSFSDFCGAPWNPLTQPCGQLATPPVGANHGCITSDPLFDPLPVVPPPLMPICGGGGSPPTCACQAPPNGSPCIDAGNDTALHLPQMDANGALRIIDLYLETNPPDGNDVDMGAHEKQTCIP